MNYRNVLPFNEAELWMWLETQYGLNVERVTIQSGYMSTVVFVDTSAERFVLKCVQKEAGLKDRLLVQISLLEHLGAKGLPVAACVRGQNQSRIFVVDEYLLSMWTFLVGDRFLPHNRQQISASGGALGRLHRSVLDWENGDKQIPSAGWGEWVSQLKSEWVTLAGSCAEGRALVNCLEAALALWPTPGETEQTLVIHNDFRAQNLVFGGNIVSGIFDFDAACLAPRMFDVAYGLIFFQAVLADGPLDESEMCAFFEAYHRVFPVEMSDLSESSSWLGLALLRGLTLWGRIAYVDCVNDRPKVWINAYLPLLNQTERIAMHLKAVLSG